MNKELKQISDMINERLNDYRQQQDIILQKLEANKTDKEQAEADRAAALESKDEKAYKSACRAIADAESGIEFINICLQELQKKHFAKTEEDGSVKRGLHTAMDKIYADAINEIEKALDIIVHISDGAVQELKTIDVLARAWNDDIMKDHSPIKMSFSQNRTISLEQYYNAANSRLSMIKLVKEKDSAFRK